MNIYDISERYERVKRSVIHHSLIQISDNGKLTVEECKEVVQFDENTVKLLLSFGTVTVTGLELKMRNFSDRGVIITGKLHSVGFDDSGKDMGR
ncbi:MAG: YabP/YqfC family sporulation protein [Ruminiclostridium sp.]|nr:YabP/YqfC family sporulation protein [Ruminiclostridium sp.]